MTYLRLEVMFATFHTLVSWLGMHNVILLCVELAEVLPSLVDGSQLFCKVMEFGNQLLHYSFNVCTECKQGGNDSNVVSKWV